jgi:hypothetical protein
VFYEFLGIKKYIHVGINDEKNQPNQELVFLPRLGAGHAVCQMTSALPVEDWRAATVTMCLQAVGQSGA